MPPTNPYWQFSSNVDLTNINKQLEEVQKDLEILEKRRKFFEKTHNDIINDNEIKENIEKLILLLWRDEEIEKVKEHVKDWSSKPKSEILYQQSKQYELPERSGSLKKMTWCSKVTEIISCIQEKMDKIIKENNKENLEFEFDEFLDLESISGIIYFTNEFFEEKAKLLNEEKSRKESELKDLLMKLKVENIDQ